MTIQVGDHTPEPRYFSAAAQREQALFNFYQAERRAGADPLTANERMAEYAKRLDALPSYKVAAE